MERGGNLIDMKSWEDCYLLSILQEVVGLVFGKNNHYYLHDVRCVKYALLRFRALSIV